MNTKLLMTLSAIVMGVTGIILSFFPKEILSYVTSTTGTILDALVLQILGALYFGFSMVNWTAKANLIGGIYGRPVAIGNLMHFAMASLALTKGYFSNSEWIILILAAIYIAFAFSFAIVFFTHPVQEKN